jgi:uncharacterized protein YdaU (DUF1376 family)
MTCKPWFRWFPGDFHNKTRHLTITQKGIYRELIDQCWLVGSVPIHDDAMMARVIGCTTKTWRHNKASILPFFEADGRQSRVEEERQKVVSPARERNSREDPKSLKSQGEVQDSLARAPVRHTQTQILKTRKKESYVQLPLDVCVKDISTQSDYSHNFLAWWAVYQRHDGKSKAFLAWKRMNGSAPPDLIDKTRHWFDVRPNLEVRYVPLAATWLNGKRWEDEDPKSMQQLRAEAEAERKRREADEALEQIRRANPQVAANIERMRRERERESLQ